MPAASRTARRQMSSVPEHSLNTEGRSTTSDLEDHCASCPPTRLRPPRGHLRGLAHACTRSSTPTASSSSTPACSTRRRVGRGRRAGADAGEHPRDVVCVINTTFTSTTAAATACSPVCRFTSSDSSCKGHMTHTNGSTSRVRPTSSTTARQEVLPGIRLLPDSRPHKRPPERPCRHVRRARRHRRRRRVHVRRTRERRDRRTTARARS